MKPKSTKIVFLILSLALCLCFVAACRRSGNEKRYDFKGKVIVVEPEKHLVTVSHEDVKGYMPAMTMPFAVKNEADLQILAPDDEITATLVIDGKHSWLEDLIISRQSATAPVMPGAQMAKEGDEVPNFTLRNQDDREIHIKDYRGKTLLLTFIYTRCPVPDYCTLMSDNFAQIDRALGQNPEVYGKTHLLSISIDPEYDTPKVLRSYGGAYTGQYTKEKFLHWDFAAPPEKELPAITQYFDVGVTPGGSNTLVHSLSTVLIVKDGKVIAWYPTNEWKPADIVARMKQAAAA